MSVRFDRRLLGRLDVEDVLQESFVDVVRRIDEYLIDPSVPVYIWLRFLTLQRLNMIQRAHLGARQRAASIETACVVVGAGFASSDSLAGEFAGSITSPSHVAMRRELEASLRILLDQMEPLDREVLALRHFEELGNNEVAAILQLSQSAASKRYVRALGRLGEILGQSAAWS